MSDSLHQAGSGLDALQLFGFSFNHHNVDLETRENLKLPPEKASQLIDLLHALEGLEEFVVLDTCNRWEIYCFANSATVVDDVWELMVDAFPLSSDQLSELVLKMGACGMIQHLFEVCSGLDSQMVGETEILGQVKGAFSKHSQQGMVGGVLHKIFSKAFQSAKLIRSETVIGRGQVSVGNITVDLAQRIFGDLKRCRVLLVGSGEVGRLVATAMKSRKAREICVSSRNIVNAQSLSNELGGEVIAFEALAEHLAEFDILLSCTSASEPVILKEKVALARRGRAHKPFFMIDLAMPRDIDPEVSKLAQVFLYNLDDVSEIANENLKSRSEEIESCRKILSRRSWTTWLEILRRTKLRRFRASEHEAS